MPNKINLSYKVAFCGVAIAIAITIMFVSIIPGFTYALPAISGLIIWAVKQHITRKWAFLAFGACSILSVLFIPEPEAVLFFIGFFGYYPLIRDFLDKIKSKIIKGILKLLTFNIPVICIYQILIRIFAVDDMLEGLEGFGTYAVYVLWAAGNIAFICYDFCITQLFYAYTKWIMPKLKSKLKQ